MPRIEHNHKPHHVYKCFDANGDLIYVGVTYNLFGRLEQHRRQSWWSGQVAKVTAKVYPNSTAGRAAERSAIRDEFPKWNKVGRWEVHSAWNRENWDDWLTLLMARATFPTGEIYARLRDYRSIWGCDPSPIFLATLNALEVKRAQDKAEWALKRAEHEKRLERVRREDEIGLRRDRKKRKKLGAPADCDCTFKSIKRGLVDDWCEAHGGTEVLA